MFIVPKYTKGECSVNLQIHQIIYLQISKKLLVTLFYSTNVPSGCVNAFKSLPLRQGGESNSLYLT